MNHRPTLPLLLIIAVLCIAGCRRTTTSPKNDAEAYTLLEQTAEANAGGDKSRAIALADSALLMTPADSTRCYLLCEKATALVDMGRMDEALRTANSAYTIAERTHNTDAMLNLCGTRGIALRRSGNTDSALAVYRSGAELAVKEHNAEYEVYLCNCLAVLYSEVARYAEASAFAQRAEKAAEASADTIEALSARATRGSILLRQDSCHEAVSLLEERWSDVERAGYNVLTLKYLSPLLKALLELDDSERLRFYMAKADSATKGVSATSNGVLGILEIKAAMLGHERHYPEQLVLLDSMLHVSSTNQAMPTHRLFAEKSHCLLTMGRTEEARVAMDSAYSHLARVNQADIDKMLSDFSVRYRTLEKEMKIEQMAHKEESMKRRELTLWFVVGLLVLSLFYFFHERRTRARLAKLKETENYLRGMERERERLAAELHDGVCNDILALTLTEEMPKGAFSNRLHDIWRDVRQLSHALMPPQLDHASLPEIVGTYISALSKEENVAYTLHAEENYAWKSIPEQAAYELYRIAQEATANALKHGNGTPVRVSLSAKGAYITIAVSNESETPSTQTFSTESRGIGLDTISQRAKRIGAEAHITHEHGTFCISVTYTMHK